MKIIYVFPNLKEICWKEIGTTDRELRMASMC